MHSNRSKLKGGEKILIDTSLEEKINDFIGDRIDTVKLNDETFNLDEEIIDAYKAECYSLGFRDALQIMGFLK